MQLNNKEITKGNIRRYTNNYYFVLLIVTIGVYLTFKYFLPLFFPFIIAYFLVKLIMPMVNFLNRKMKLPKIIGSILVILVIGGAVGAIVFYIGTLCWEEFRQFIIDLPVYQRIIDNKVNDLCCHLDHVFNFELGCSKEIYNNNLLKGFEIFEDCIMPKMTQRTMNVIMLCVGFFSIAFIIMISVVTIIIDFDELKEEYLNSKLYSMIHPFAEKLGIVGIAYLKTQGTLLCLNIIILGIGFFLIKSKYTFLFSVGIAIMDSLPVIGSGLFLIPMAVVKLIQGKFYHMAILVSVYAVCETTRSLLEPRLLGNKIGIKPIFTIISMFVGVKLFGIIGFLLGPFGIVIIKIITEEYMKRNGN